MVMQSAWPWLAVAAAGALHGMNPATGWAFAACSGRVDAKARTLRAVMPIAVGHVAALILVAAAVRETVQIGVDFDPLVLQGLAAALLLVLAVRHLRGRGHRTASAAGGRAGLALWSFIVATAHGAGWMLVPALVPLCASDMPAREIAASGSVVLMLAAVGVHMTAMLAVSAAMALGARRGFDAACAWLRARRSKDTTASCRVA
jgi:hypothetical protein